MPPANDPRNELRQEIKQILETTVRIDERFKTMIERQAEFHTRLNYLSEQISLNQSRLAGLEARNGTDFKKIAEGLSNEIHDIRLKLAQMDIAGTVPTKKTIVDLDDLSTTVVDMGHRLGDMEKSSTDWSSKTKAAGIELLKVVLAMLGAYLLFRWGVK